MDGSGLPSPKTMAALPIVSFPSGGDLANGAGLLNGQQAGQQTGPSYSHMNGLGGSSSPRVDSPGEDQHMAHMDSMDHLPELPMDILSGLHGLSSADADMLLSGSPSLKDDLWSTLFAGGVGSSGSQSMDVGLGAPLPALSALVKQEK